MKKWSKGPWHSDFADIHSDDGRLVATVRERRMKGGCPDTRLIEAAPDLAEALERALMPMHDAAIFLGDSADDAEQSVGAILWKAYEQAAAALAKARGEA